LAEGKRKLFATQTGPERVFLVGVASKASTDGWSAADSLEELAYLARTANAAVVGELVQRLDAPSPAHYIGRGKLGELRSLREQVRYDTVVFDDDLSPRQQRNLEEALEVKVIDRTALILDIFARHARTREGQLQVELAQHQYLLPRLVGQWGHLERLGGGIGTRGPGESQLETDRRLINKRISRLEREIAEVRRHRDLYRKRRRERGVPVVALVGYTNAGKSTLFNTLGKASMVVEDALFSTLDPVTRRFALPGGQQFLITDTVGFIHKLPTLLIAAFRATLEELGEASLLLHVVDIMHKNAVHQCRTVEEMLKGLHLEGKSRLTVFNKLDLALNSEAEMESLSLSPRIPLLEQQVMLPGENIALISAAKGWGVGKLLEKVISLLNISGDSGKRSPAS